ncbi:MAG TPA: MHYT domain-containing protein [Alphaproteobacteria bacterium]
MQSAQVDRHSTIRRTAIHPFAHAHLTGSYDWALVALSVAIAMFASFVALDVAGRLRAAANGRARAWWLALDAFTMGGGIWAMHFVAMLSFRIDTPLGYDVPLTAASLAVAIGMAGVGLLIAGGGPFAWRRLLPAGLCMGLGIAAMHYVGMSAMRMAATIHYDMVLLVASIVIAVIAATLALWFALHEQTQWHRLLSAAIMASAISGMHFTGMAAARYSAAPDRPHGAMDLTPALLAIVVAGTAFFLLLLGLVSAIADRRLSANRARAARRLEFNARRYRSLIRNSSDVIAILDERSQFTYCSESAKRILGFAPNGLVGRRLDEFLSPAELGPFYAFLGRVQEAQGVNMTSEIRLRHADGQWRSFEIICCYLRDDAGIGGIVANLRDITERKRSLDSLLAAKDLADDANRSKSEFLAAMSHELRTPLNAIIGFSEVISSGILGADAGPRAIDYAKHIHESGKHLLSLINDILDLSKAESGRMTLLEDYIRPADVAADCLRMVGTQAEAANVAIVASVSGDLPYLYGDKRRVRQVLINILTNAFKFSHPGGRVVLTGVIDRGGAKGDLLFVIQDSGIGMSPEEVATSLEPFRQIDSSLSRKYDGTGLGLPLTKHLMELHGGALEIESASGVGTTVTLRFPASRLHATVAPEDSFELDDDARASA